MKRLFNLFAISGACSILALAGCEKKDPKVFLESGETPVLSASTSAAVLDPQKESSQAIAFGWTNPNYVFTTGPSSQDVTYRLEIDTVGSNFKNPSKGVVTLSNALSTTFTVFDLNVLLSGANGMNLPPDRNYNFEARVVSSLRNNSVQLTSNTVRFSARPYSPPPAVQLPSTGRLFLVGSATPGVWANPVPANQEFIKVTNTRYELIVPLTGGKSLLFLPVNGSWDDKYGWDGSNDQNIPTGDKMRRGGGDIKVPAADGQYKIVADFQAGRFTITRQ